MCAADWPKSARVLLGDGALNNLKGSAHNTLRQVLEPGMTQDAVSARLPLVIRVMNERLKAWARNPKVNMYFKSKEIPFMVIPNPQEHFVPARGNGLKVWTGTVCQACT